MTNSTNGEKWARFTERVGLPGAVLLLILAGIYFGVAKPLVASAVENMQAQTNKLDSIHTVVEADAAEDKAAQIAEIRQMLQRQTIILERLSLIMEELSDRK